MKINKPVVLAIALLILSWMFLENKVLTDRRIKALEASIQHQPPPANETILKFGDWCGALTLAQRDITNRLHGIDLINQEMLELAMHVSIMSQEQDHLKKAMEMQQIAIMSHGELIREIGATNRKNGL